MWGCGLGCEEMSYLLAAVGEWCGGPGVGSGLGCERVVYAWQQ